MRDLLRQIVAELRGSWRFRWIAMTVSWFVCLFGWLAVYSLADSYESEATVYVDTNSLLKPLLSKLTVDSNMLGRVDLVTAAMMGKPQLEKVARETNMHLRAKNRAEFDAMIYEMERRVSVANNPSRDPNLFNIKYRDSDPRLARDVVSSLVSIFVEDSLSANRQGTEKAQQFLRDELGRLEADLTASETRLAQFKKENVGRMPNEGGGYFARLQNNMDELDDIRWELSLAIKRRETLKLQLSGEQPTIKSENGPQSALDKRIATNQNRLEELQLRFTDQHPDVVATKATLEQLRNQRQRQIDNFRNSGGAGVASDNPVFQNIQISLTGANVEIATLTEKEANQIRRIEKLKELTDVLPEVEANLARLTRDYDVKQSQYRSILQRLEVAELSESAEESEDVKFRVIDPPFLPDQPTAPNRPLLLLFVWIVGIGAGSGAAFLINQTKPVFSDLTTLRDETGLPVLGSVFAMKTIHSARLRVRQVTTFGSVLLGLCLLFVVAILFNRPGSDLVNSLIAGVL